MKTCACGCGLEVKGYNYHIKRPIMFRPGHQKIRLGVRRHSEGYILIYQPTHPRADRYGYTFEHILVMEKHLDRPLINKEEIHHINGKKDDNKLENLELVINHSEHMKHHFPKGKPMYYNHKNTKKMSKAL